MVQHTEIDSCGIGIAKSELLHCAKRLHLLLAGKRANTAKHHSNPVKEIGIEDVSSRLPLGKPILW